MTTNLWRTLFSLSLLLATSSVYADNLTVENRYQVRDGLVKDTKTGLIWMRCSVGQKWDGSTCQGDAARYSWKKAKEMLTYYQFSNFKDWRIPSHEELKSLVYCSTGQINKLDKEHSQCYDNFASPTILQTAFPQTPENWFWTATPQYKDWFWSFPFSYFGNFSWAVDFSNGLDRPSHKDDSGHLRLVRNDK